MSGRITLWGAGQLMSAYFGKGAPIPDTFYLAAMKTTPPSPYVSGSELDEPTGGGYQRLAIPNNGIYWTNTGQIQVALLNTDVTFAAATASWGELRYWALCNASVEGFAYFVGTLETPVTINVTDSLQVGAGDLGVSVGPFFAAEDG